MTTTGAVLAALLAAAGCTRSMPSFDSVGGPAPLTPAPTGQVAANRLPPPPPPPPPPPAPEETMAANQADPNDPAAMDESGNMAANDMATSADAGQSDEIQTASTGGGSVTREGMVGAWKVSAGGGNCQIFMALTQWTGGYRAASRGCPGQVADVSAWNVSGGQVVLKDSGGSTVATLSSSGDARYSGQTSGGTSISLYR